MLLYVIMGLMLWLVIGILNYIFTNKTKMKEHREGGDLSWSPTNADFGLCLLLGPILGIITVINNLYYYGRGYLNTLSGLNDDILSINNKTFHIDREGNNQPSSFYSHIESFTVIDINLLNHTVVKIIDSDDNVKSMETNDIMIWIKRKAIKELSEDELAIMTIH